MSETADLTLKFLEHEMVQNVIPDPSVMFGPQAADFANVTFVLLDNLLRVDLRTSSRGNWSWMVGIFIAVRKQKLVVKDKVFSQHLDPVFEFRAAAGTREPEVFFQDHGLLVVQGAQARVFVLLIGGLAPVFVVF